MSGSLRSRAVWVIADSALSSLANAGLTIGLARVVSAGEYGSFALAFTVFSLAAAASQALSSQVVVIVHSGASPDVQRQAIASATGVAAAFGAASGLIVLAVALLRGQSAPAAVLVMAVGLPALLLQDAYRATFVAQGVPRRAFMADAIWVLAWALAFLGLHTLTGTRSAAPYILAWAMAAGLVCVLAATTSRTFPDVRSTWSWLVRYRDVIAPSLANTIAIMGALQVAFLLIPLLGSIQDLGALRGAQTLLGPLNILGFAATSFALPELIRRDPGRRGWLLAAVGLSAVLVVVAAVWGLVLLSLPEAAGRELLGDTWPRAREALPWMVVYVCAINATVGATAVMRGLNRVRSALWVSLILGPIVVVCSAVGTVLANGYGASVGFAFAAGLVVVPCWLLLVRDVSKGRRAIAH